MSPAGTLHVLLALSSVFLNNDCPWQQKEYEESETTAANFRHPAITLFAKSVMNSQRTRLKHSSPASLRFEPANNQY